MEDNVEFIPTPIKRVVKDGIETEDGKKREVDIIICATGFDEYIQSSDIYVCLDTSANGCRVHKQHFPVSGKNGINLQDLWDDFPEAYLSLAPAPMPNFFRFLGPNGGAAQGSNVPFLESVVCYVCKTIKKIQREFIRSMVVK